MKTRANGIEVNYELHGREGAPWLVLSHSLACSVRMWDPQIAALKDQYRILAYDTRGHGASEATKGAYTLELLADDLFFLLQELRIEQAHFCGLSMGGMIGQTFALKYPGIFRTLTLADTTCHYPAAAAPVWTERIKLVESKGMEPLAQPTLERWFTEPFRNNNPAAVEAIRKLILATPVAGYAGCSHAIPTINVSARLKEIKCPILVIVGADDPGTPVSMAEEIHANAPGSKLVVLPQAAHLANLEQPEGFTNALRDFLRSS
ncbi:MAG: 3-oxoadipate enol-lactonase [Betaproteobacteria bacterium]|nr:3-oxoadipate enol-lactonase [Betaproteobacteria bacterium]MSQ88684.1 3-oxoadipate enol-lactonase [Betaproteobacteria bacterium]